MNKARQLNRQLDNFVEKLAGVNKPFQALKKQPEYKDFHQMFKDAITKQMQWGAQHVGEAVRHGDLKQYFDRNMPGLKEFVNKQDVVDFYIHCFEWGVASQYQRMGVKVGKAQTTEVRKAVAGFTLTNQHYLDRINDNAAYLINQSSLDDTTKAKVIQIIQNGIDNVDDEGEADPLTNDVIAGQITDSIDDFSSYRGDMIARTESASAMGDGNYAALQENDVPQIEWVTAGDNPCIICQDNEDASPINLGDTFPSGDTNEPAHPNCECYTQGVADSINLDDMSIWDGSDDGSDE